MIVHGAFADGSGWRRVYDLLKIQGYSVSLVQNPLTSLEDDVAATRRILDRQSGPTILVGHSYGGTIITEAGNHSKVACLVYIAAFAPDSGESTLDQYSRVPPPACFQPEVQPDGFAFLRRGNLRCRMCGSGE
ncbi:alpha/beta hydrolase [Rhizobium sp. RCAM05350]|nr:alpha/beta hydrolase [Rhizobium sp. RCAM05350]